MSKSAAQKAAQKATKRAARKTERRQSAEQAAASGPADPGAAVLDQSGDGRPEPASTKTRLVVGAILLVATVLVVRFAGPTYCRVHAQQAAEVLDYEEADAWLRRAAWLDGGDPEIDLLRSRIARRRGQKQEVIDLIKSASDKGAGRERLLREVLLSKSDEGDIGPLAAAMPQLVAGGEDLPEIYESMVRGQFKRFDLQAAGETIDFWKQEFPQSSRPYLFAARLAEFDSDVNGAIAEVEAALERRPDSGWAWYMLGQLYGTMLRHEDSLAAYQKAADLLEEPEPALVRAAGALRELGRYDEARETIERALARPDDRLAEMHRLLGGVTEDARSAALIQKGRIALDSERPEEAIDAFEAALEIHPYERRSRNNYATALRQVGRLEEAAAQSERVAAITDALNRSDRMIQTLKSNPTDVEARVSVGQMLLEFIDPDQGAYWLRTALELDPDNREALQPLAAYYRRQGRDREAERLERRLGRLGPAEEEDAEVEADQTP